MIDVEERIKNAEIMANTDPGWAFERLTSVVREVAKECDALKAKLKEAEVARDEYLSTLNSVLKETNGSSYCREDIAEGE